MINNLKKEFRIYWGQPSPQMYAVWPAPVNADVCFEAAGFEYFDDADAEWDTKARCFLSDLLDILKIFGNVHPIHGPLEIYSLDVPWYKKIFNVPRHKEATGSLSLEEELEIVMHNDSFPRYEISFGKNGSKLAVGNGHYLLWLEVAMLDNELFRDHFNALLMKYNAVQTDLKWEHLRIT